MSYLIITDFLVDPFQNTLTIFYHFPRCTEPMEENYDLTTFWSWMVLNDLDEGFGDWWFEKSFTNFGHDVLVADLDLFEHYYDFREKLMIVGRFIQHATQKAA